jgi:hypothetical protein
MVVLVVVLMCVWCTNGLRVCGLWFVVFMSVCWMDGMGWHVIPQYLLVLITVCPSIITSQLHLLFGRLFSSRLGQTIRSGLISSLACDDTLDISR